MIFLFSLTWFLRILLDEIKEILLWWMRFLISFLWHHFKQDHQLWFFQIEDGFTVWKVHHISKLKTMIKQPTETTNKRIIITINNKKIWNKIQEKKTHHNFYVIEKCHKLSMKLAYRLHLFLDLCLIHKTYFHNSKYDVTWSAFWNPSNIMNL